MNALSSFRLTLFQPAPLAVAVMLFSCQASAALTDLGNGTILDSDLASVWTKDGNLFKSQATNPSLVFDIIGSAGGAITDSGGTYVLSSGDFDTGAGTLTWYGAKAWVGYLNSIGYAGHSDWRLPSVSPVNGTSFVTVQSFDGTSDVGYNNGSPASELGHLFYTELGNKGYYTTSGATQTPYGVTNAGPFTNLRSAVHWSGTEFDSANAWYFSTAEGLQFNFDKTQQYAALAIAPVPEPATASLLVVGLVAMGLGIGRRRQARCEAFTA